MIIMFPSEPFDFLTSILQNSEVKRGVAFLDSGCFYPLGDLADRALFVYKIPGGLKVFVCESGVPDSPRQRLVLAGQAYPGMHEFNRFGELTAQAEEFYRQRNSVHGFPRFDCWMIEKGYGSPLGMIITGKTEEDEDAFRCVPEFDDPNYEWTEREWGALGGMGAKMKTGKRHRSYARIIRSELDGVVNPIRTVAFVQRSGDGIVLAKVEYDLMREMWRDLTPLKVVDLSYLVG